MESLLLWLGVGDPFFKFLIAFGGLVTILFLAILIPSIILGMRIAFWTRFRTTLRMNREDSTERYGYAPVEVLDIPPGVKPWANIIIW